MAPSAAGDGRPPAAEREVLLLALEARDSCVALRQYRVTWVHVRAVRFLF